MIKVIKEHATSFLSKRYVNEKKVEAIHQMIHEKTGEGADFLGWVDQPINPNKEEIEKIKEAVKRIKETSQVLVVIGIGGSYLGAKSAIEMLKKPFLNEELEILFAGYQMSSIYMESVIGYLEQKDFSINVISKSGTTIEPALAFRLLNELLIKKYGEKEANKRVYVTTDKTDGTLKRLANLKGYPTFEVPKNIGGRFSVLSAVGLLPICAAGIDIDLILQGAQKAYYDHLSVNNPAYEYAKLRYGLYKEKKTIEMFISYEPTFKYFSEWLKQLFGESEGKKNKGLFVASATFSTDLHSLGQLIQEGPRNLFETVIKIKKPAVDVQIPYLKNDYDELNYLASKDLHEINEKAFLGTLFAHKDGGVPNIVIELETINPYMYGYMVYFFFKACAMSAYLLEVNPFDQPGVESYKKNMFALLGKPSFEELKRELEEKIKGL